jgi:PKD repeat protein
MAVYKDELYVGGAFDSINSMEIFGIARYKDTTTIKNCNYLQPRIFISYNDITDSSLVQFKNNIKSATSWEWDFGDGNQAFVQNPEHQYTQIGTYNVTVTVTHDGCTATYTREVVVDKILSAPSISPQGGGLKVYPNPTTGVIEILSDEVIERIEIIDVNGKVMFNYELQITNYELDISHLSKGVYYIKATHSNGKSSQQKLVKE